MGKQEDKKSIINDVHINTQHHQNKVDTSILRGEVIRNNETYVVEDNNALEHLTLSKTTLHPGKQTGGHYHDDQEEIYHFVYGTGTMQVGSSVFPVKAGDIVMIPKGDWHQVKNHSSTDPLIFVCVFEKYTRGDEKN